MTSNINVNLRLRPIRFGFLVRPDDARRTLQIFRTNICLWGGQYNPVIPFFKRIPQWWERKGYRFENARQIVNGYLDFFEPDFLVEAEGGLAGHLGFDPERVLKLTDLLEREGERDKNKYGFSVHDLYGNLYRKKFQFETRHKQGIVHVTARERSFRNFVACVFGSFPTQPALKYFERNFKDIFDPAAVRLDAGTCLELYRTHFITPLMVGHSRIEVDYHDHRDPTLFILDAHEPKDLIDFWNLRATHRDVIPVPVQWLKQLSPFCKDFIQRNYRPLPGNPHGVMIRPTSMFSRSIPEEDIEPLHKAYLRVDKEGANCLQTWYPPIWRETPRFTVRMVRPTLDAGSKSVDQVVEDDKPDIRFEPLYPEYSRKYGNRYRWANVAKLTDWSHRDRWATVFPCDYRNPSYPDYRLGRELLLPTAEGLVFFPEHRDLAEHWKLTEGTTALNAWFGRNGITAVPSDAGRATQQIVQTLQGFWGVRALAHGGIVTLLNEMSRRPLTRSAHYWEFRNKVANAIGKDIWRDRDFETLVNRKVVELGLELRCAKCGSWSWYALDQLGYSLSCDLCLKHYEFPITDPTSSKSSRWAYRLQGPFALPNYANGGYAAALSIRFFADVLGHVDRSKVTWSVGQELTLPSGKKSEPDFILWYQRQQMFGTNYPTDVVFGEAKSFGRDAFKDEDVARMKTLAEQFPGTILVFATMKEASDLSADEIDRMRRLAQWGREYDRERKQSRAPVIVLTGTELFVSHYLSIAWKEKGGLHQKLIEPGWVQEDDLRVLADLTQQLYLGMPSYGTWREESWRKRAERRKRKRS